MFFSRKRPKKQEPRRALLQVEQLESRLVPYAVSGNLWPHPELITIGFVPVGTVLGANGGGAITSNLQATFNARFGSASAWQDQILKAAQVFAQQTNINFTIITDNGGAIGSGNYQQGDPLMADIRIGGYHFGTGVTTLAQAYLPPPVNNYSIAGDMQFNTNQTFSIGTGYDVYTVAMHEFGHALGLYHSTTISAVEYHSYTGVKTGLHTDDINGIRAIYSGSRAADSDDATASNGTLATAADITSVINTTSQTASLERDITTTSDLDFYKFTAPTGLGGTLTIKAQSQGLSLLAPTLTVYNSAQTQVASASGSGMLGATLTTSLTVTAGQVYYVKVAGANTTSFGTGKYALEFGFAGTAAPAVVSLNTQTLNDPNPSSGGGQASTLTEEGRVNSYTSGTQETNTETRQATAMDELGNYVVVWASQNQDGSGYGVYAQRYNTLGVALGSEFRVNTTTSGDQRAPSVAMNATGSFVIAWQSGSDAPAVYFQRYSVLGVALGGEVRVSSTSDHQKNPVVGIDALGQVVVAWQENDGVDESWNVYTQRYNTLGLAQGGKTLVNTATTNEQLRPALAMDASGNSVITWTSKDQDGSGYGVYAQRFNANGVKQGSEFRVNATTLNDQDYSSVSYAGSGQFVVTWSSKAQDGSGWGVYARRYNAAGTVQGGEFRVNTRTANDQMHSSAAGDNAGNFFITWSSNAQDGSGWGIFGRQYNASGAALGGELLVNTTTTSDQTGASAVIGVSGDAVVVWKGTSNDSGDIFTQLYHLGGGHGSGNLDAEHLEAGEPHGFGPDPCCGCGAPQNCFLCTTPQRDGEQQQEENLFGEDSVASDLTSPQNSMSDEDGSDFGRPDSGWGFLMSRWEGISPKAEKLSERTSLERKAASGTERFGPERTERIKQGVDQVFSTSAADAMTEGTESSSLDFFLAPPAPFNAGGLEFAGW